MIPHPFQDSRSLSLFDHEASSTYKGLGCEQTSDTGHPICLRARPGDRAHWRHFSFTMHASWKISHVVGPVRTALSHRPKSSCCPFVSEECCLVVLAPQQMVCRLDRFSRPRPGVLIEKIRHLAGQARRDLKPDDHEERATKRLVLSMQLAWVSSPMAPVSCASRCGHCPVEDLWISCFSYAMIA